MSRPGLALVFLAALLAPRDAHADEPPAPYKPTPTRKLEFGGAHVAYALGPAAGDESGFRQGLDIGGLAAYSSYEGGSSSGLPSTQSSVLFGASSLIGFGKYPTYIAGEIGGGTNNSFTGGAGLIGPAVRVDPKAGGGLALRLAFDALLFQIGFHLIAILVPDRDIVFAFTFGFGRN